MSEIVEITDAGDIICHLKAAVTALECQHKMDLERQKIRRKPEKSPPAPMFMMIPLEQKVNDQDSIFDDSNKRSRKQRYERDSNGDSISDLRNKRRNDRRRNTCSENKGPTMRGGVLHNRCGCIHRDGLQDSCPLTECRGHPDCLVKPWAICPPARYFRSRFPEIYPAPSNSDDCTFST